MTMLRRAVIAIGENGAVSRFIKSSSLCRGVVNRFVAGETLDAAITAAQSLAAEGLTTTLDQLGEDVGSAAEATAAVSTYTTMLEHLAAADLEPNISVKLTMLGLDFDETLAQANMEMILATAKAVSGFVRIDMEGSAHTEATLRVFTALHDRFPEQVGIVIQAYLKRSEADIEAMIGRGARVRLVKGAYAEPEAIAFQKSPEVQQNFQRLMRMLLDRGAYPAIATHDPEMIAATSNYATQKGYAADRFEFQMLYGVRRDEQRRIAQQGQRMRVYVPYGTEWYPYFTRRIAERPANALFVLRNLRG
jgi:proline dehydrogenase